MRWGVLVDANVVGCLVIVAVPLLAILALCGWLAGLWESHEAVVADVPGSIHQLSSSFSGPGQSSPTTMPCFRTRADLEQWIRYSEEDDKNGYRTFKGDEFGEKALLQLNGDERVRILEEDGQILRVRILPLPRGSTYDDFIDVHRRDIGQRCYTIDEDDLFQSS